MNNKGFTLVELIATIVVLVLLMGLGTYAIANVINRSKQNSYELLVGQIKDAAELYYQECKYGGTLTTSQCDMNVTLGELVTLGFLKGNGENKDNSVVNPKNNEDIKACVITVAFTSGRIVVTPNGGGTSCPTTDNYQGKFE